MSRLPRSVGFNQSVGSGSGFVPTRPLTPADLAAATRRNAAPSGVPSAARSSATGTDAPAGQRPLRTSERAHNDTWAWSPELGTYTCVHYPSGLA